MEEKLYRNRDWLYHHYIELRESTYAMAREAKCGQRAIWLWLRKFDIPTRAYRESALLRNAREFQPYRNEDWLREHYIDLQESTYTMAQEAECGDETIRKWLHKFDIPVRACGEGIFLALRNYLDISPELLGVLSGELLGDGHIRMSGSRSARYCHTSKYREYVTWLSRTFADLGVEQVGKINKRWIEKDSVFSYNYTSRSYPELIPLRQRWYPDGIKIVPKDLILTPIMARQFYIGDGCLGNNKEGCPHVIFYTNDFDKASIDYLLREFRNKGFKVNHRPSNNTIGMWVESVKDFLGWIGPCPIDCYSYKWNYRDNRKKMQRQLSVCKA